MPILLWLRALFFRARVETEMEKELRLHLEMETENNIRLGLSPAAARRAALLAFGGVEQTKEAVRDERRTRWLEQIAGDLHFALRGFRKHPAFVTGVVAMIALGVGANVAIFSVVDRLLISPLPYADGNRMIDFVAVSGGGTVRITPTASDVDRWRARTRLVEQITTARWWTYELGDSSRGPTEHLSGVTLSSGAAAFVGARPLIGRDVQPADTLIDAPLVALLSYPLWQRSFGGRPEIVGQSILLSGERHLVIGVMPPGFSLPFIDGDQIFTAFRSAGQDRGVDVIAKLKPGVTVEQANRELKSIWQTSDAQPGVEPPRVARAIDRVPRDTRRIVFLMFAAVIMVLVIACANVANLLLARAWTRQRELAVRAAMGATRARLVRQMFTESLTLSLAGGVLGAGVAVVTLQLLVAAQPTDVTQFNGARLDAPVLLAGLGVTLVVGVLFGLAPALFVVGNRAGESLKAGTRAASGSRAARRVRSGLVIAEVALSATLLVASGLLVRTIVTMQRASVGFDTHGLWGVFLRLDAKALADDMGRRAIVESMLARVRGLPGVRGATLAMSLPPDFATGMGGVEIEGRPVLGTDSLQAINITTGHPDLFALAGIHLVRGRVFSENTTATGRVPGNEVIVNASFAERFWPHGDALGARVRRGGRAWGTIVGIASDVRLPGSRRRAEATQFYQAMSASPSEAELVVRSDTPMATLLPAVESAIREASPVIKVSDAQTADGMVVRSRAAQRFALTLIGAFTLLAVVLAAIGLHAVVAYSVSQRTREIGVRIALGAQSHDVIGLVIGQGFWLSVGGIVVGAVAGTLTARTMRALLYQVAPGDPVTLVAVSVLLVAVALVASYAPARRAVNVDPVDALRAD